MQNSDNQSDRRTFVKASAIGIAASAGFHSSARAKAVSRSPNAALKVGVMGVNGRGTSLARSFASQKDVDVAAICDVDSRAINKAKSAVKDLQKLTPESYSDFRKILDDKSIDILVCAAPNHWHAPATILGCSAGKHVYVEKPCSHTAWEGEMAVAAARKHNRVVQMGTQRRSTPMHMEAIKRIHAGEIGNVMFARTWYNNRRGSIGKGKSVAVPSWLDYELWQGPCTDKPFKSNLVHYNWHWHWHWGNGELGNNGVHALDVARWGMQVDFPTRVTSAGGRYRWVDDQETADTHMVTFEFDKKMMTWEGLSWSPTDTSGSAFGISFHGDKGSLQLLDSGYKILDIRNKLIAEVKKGGVDDAAHIANFLDCARNGGKPNCDIEEAHKSTLLCHLGNIAQRTQDALEIDPQNGHIKNNNAAEAFWSKDYRQGWKPELG